MKILVLMVTILITGCSKEAIQKSATNNGSIEVELLFSHKGCNIYRFQDSRPVYFTDCGMSTYQDYSESCGKNCTKRVRRQNLGVKR